MSKTCTVKGCNNKVKAKNLCCKHYEHMRLYGHIKRTKYDANEIIKHEDEDYAEIILYDSFGEEVARSIIDLDVVEHVENIKWGLDGRNYVYGKINGKIIKLHRYLLGPKEEEVVDHINHNTLDNRKSNLRLCTKQQNNMNRSKTSKNTSGVVGVYWDKSRGKYAASICINRHSKFLGYFNTVEEAAEARRQAEIEYFGEFAPDRE